MANVREAVNEAMYDAVPAHVDDAPTARAMPFVNRFAAGRDLGRALARLSCADAVVLGVGRGGSAVAQGVADTLRIPFGVWLARRMLAPGTSGVVLGVISEGSSLVLDPCGLARSGMTFDAMYQLIRATADRIALEGMRLRRGGAAPSLEGRTVFLVADGIPAEDLLAAAIGGLRKRGAVRVIVAAPIGVEWAVARLAEEAEAVVCLLVSPTLDSIGAWYQEFPVITDTALMQILAPVARG